MSFLGELRRRNVFRVGAAYLVAAWLVLQVADVVLETVGAPAWVMKAVLVVLLLGFPLALVVAWVFELTPQGLQRTSEVDPARSIARDTGRRLNYAIIAILALAVALLLYDRLAGSAREHGAPVAATEVGAKSIAVLPFVNMSSDPDNEYFSDGLSEELLNLLAKVDGLKVAARTSSFKFKGSRSDIEEIGAALGVATVLEGSVRKAGDQVRITAQLINVADGFHVWSETYDRSVDDIFRVQDEIAGAIVEALKLPLMGAKAEPVAARATQSLEAYDLYLLGRHRIRETTAASFREAIGYFERAIAADAGYAPAHSGLADAYLGLSNYGDLPMAEALPAATQAVDRALALDPALAEAWVSRGLLESWKDQPRESLASLQKALELNPNSAAALLQQASALGQLGRSRDALASATRALELDRMSDYVRQQHLLFLGSAGYAEEALQRAVAWAAAEPENPFPFEGMGDAYLLNLGQPQRSVRPYARAHEQRPGDTYMARRIVQAFLEMNDLPAAKRWLEKARSRGPRTQFTQVAEYEVALYEGDVAAQDQLLQRYLREAPESAATLTALAGAQLRSGQMEAARETLRRHLELLQDDPGLPLMQTTVGPAVHMAFVNQRLGDRAEFERWLGRVAAYGDAVLADAPKAQSGHLLAARIASLKGDREAMLVALRAAMRQGFRTEWRLRVDPLFSRWKEDRAFKVFVAQLRRQNEALRNDLLQSRTGAALAAP